MQEDPCPTAARPSIEANNRELEGSSPSRRPRVAELAEAQGSLWYKALNIIAVFPVLTYSPCKGPISSVTVFGQTLIILNEAHLAIEPTICYPLLETYGRVYWHVSRIASSIVARSK